MNNRSSVRLVPEEPVGLTGDALGFAAYARTLADAARDSSQPLTIGVFGEWGTGKSSLMRMVSDSLQEYDSVVTVECNAWQFQHEDQPLFPLVASVIRRFDDYRSERPRALDMMREHLRRAADTVGSESPNEWPLTQVNAAPADMSDRLDALLEKSQYARAFQLLSEIEVPQGWKFVVFVDDLDRCSPERAVRLLESIKLVLAQPGFVFVLGVSRDMIEEHLKHIYCEVLGVTKFDESSYLEKLVQLPFQIPSHRDRISNLADRLAETIKEPELIALLEMLAPVFEYNPRKLIRVVNNLITDRSINENLRHAGTMDHVPIGMFAVSRALQHRWPSVHRLLELAPKELAAKVVSWKQNGLPETEGSELPEDEAYVADAMRQAPELTSLLHSDAGIKWLEDEAGREAAAQFVRRHKQETAPHPVDEIGILDAYISYPKQHSEIASELWKNLTSKGLDVFLDRESVGPGENAQEVMEASLQGARALIFLCGAATPKNTKQRQEALAMVDRQDSLEAPVIIPALLPDVDHEALVAEFPDLARWKTLDLRGDEPPPYEQATGRILRALKHGKAQRSRKS